MALSAEALAERVDVARIAEAFERSGRTAAEVAEGIGMTKRVGAGRALRVQGDSTRLLRLLGLKPNSGHTTSTTIDYDLAIAVVRELCVDPRDVGL